MRSVFAILLLLTTGSASSSPSAAHTTGNAQQSQGKQVFDRWCMYCHAPGPRFPGTASLAVKYGTQIPAALQERTDLTYEVVHHFVRSGALIMPPFRKTEITDAELDALSAYLSRTSAK